MSQPKTLLLFSHDLSYAFTKTTECLAQASERMGIKSIVRDSCNAKLIYLVLETLENNDPPLLATEQSWCQRMDTLINEFDIDCVMSLDMHWMIVPEYFIEHPKIKKIYSIWFDDIWSWSRAKTNYTYPCRRKKYQEIISHPKVVHCYYGEALAHEASRMGFNNQIISRLAAPKEYLSMNYPCEITNKLVFIGNPGYRGNPHPEVLKRMKEGADFRELRALSRQEIILSLDEKNWPWLKEHEDMADLVKLTMAAKIESPFISALELLELCGEKYPGAFEKLNSTGAIMSAAWMVKLILRYDRPALVHYLYEKDLADVMSNQDEWKPYGIKAGPSIFGNAMPQYYMKYVAHLNAANCTRDATANEKLFEIAACSRVSINIDSPDVRACYDEGEVCYIKTLPQAEEVARELLAHPEKALSMGKRARLRTAKEHTWDHRLKALFQHFN